VSEGEDVRSAGCVEPVYDILNCGDRSAFTVVLPDGRLILSHNCDQAISRDLLVHGMRLAKKEGLSVRVHVHDQIVALVPERNADRSLQILKECMQDVPVWAKGLPMGSAGFLSNIFTKD
jgi:DNA polymerase